MWRNTITTCILLSVTSSYGGVVRRSTRPFQSAKELLSMRGASDAIKRSFMSAGSDLENLAQDLEREIREITQLSAYINNTETKSVTAALAEAKDIEDVIYDQRVGLSNLAKETIRKSERILRKFKETVAGDRELDRGIRSILRDMRTLLFFSERKLKEAQKKIEYQREKVNRVSAALSVFQALVEAAKKRDKEVSAVTSIEDVQNIAIGIAASIDNGYDNYNKANPGDGTISVVKSVISGISSLTPVIMEAVNRPEVAPILKKASDTVSDAIQIVGKTHDELEKEVALIVSWQSAIDQVKGTVFGGDLKSKKKEDQDLFEDVQEIIEDGDVIEIYQSFEGLKDAAQNYLTTIKGVCPYCVE